MKQKIMLNNKILFELETVNGQKFLKKENKKASKMVGEPIFVRIPLDNILNSHNHVIYLS